MIDLRDLVAHGDDGGTSTRHYCQSGGGRRTDETCRFVDDPPTFVDALILFKVTEFVSC